MPENAELVRVFAQIQDPDVMAKFFEEIFTESERQTLALRWKLMKMLDQGIPQRKIAKDLRISLCKITRGAKIMKDHRSVCYQIIHHAKYPDHP